MHCSSSIAISNVMSPKLSTIIVLCLLQLIYVTYAVGVDIRNGSQDMLTVCPGEMVSLTCSHDNVNGEQTRWQVRNNICIEVVLHDANTIEYNCGTFPIINVSDTTGSTLNSTIVIPVTSDLNGVVIECLAGGVSSSPLAGDVTLNVIDVSSVNWVANVRSDGSAVQWDPLDLPYQSCVTGYNVSLNKELYNTITTSLSPAGGNLSYCDTHTVSVTPLTLSGPLSTVTSNITIINPDFKTPQLYSVFSISESGELELQVMVQNISFCIVPMRMYGYIQNGEDCVSNMPFNGTLATIDFSAQTTGAMFTVCVLFRNNECTAVSNTTVTVPPTMLSVVGENTVSDTSYTLQLTPPLTAHPPHDLIILITLTPSQSHPLNQSFPSTPHQTVTVTFTDLIPRVEYSYTVRIVLVSDQSRDVVPSVTGQFTLEQVEGTPPAEAEFPIALVGGVIGGVILVLIVSVIIVAFAIVIVKRRQNYLAYSQDSVHQEKKHVIGDELSDYAIPQDLKYRSSSVVKLNNMQRISINYDEDKPSEYAVPQDIKYGSSNIVRLNNTQHNSTNCNSIQNGTTPKLCSDEGIYSMVFDALPRGSTSKVVGGHKNKV